MALLVALATACSGAKSQPESPFVKEGPPVPDTCCCKSSPLTATDGRPVFENVNRMECSTIPGTCVADGQCAGKPPS